MLDSDLAEIYGYRTKKFNEQVKNNIEKFDEDFRFQLTKAEVENLSRSNFLTLEPQKILRSKKSASSWGGVIDRIFKHAGEIRKYNISKKEWMLNGDSVMYGASYELKTALRAGISRKVLPEPANG